MSCEEQENVMFDAVNGQTLVQFVGTSTSLPVKPSTVSTANLQVNVTTSATVDRKVSVTIDASSTASPDQYTISDVVIPAGEFVGTGQLTGNYDNLPSIGSVSVVIKITGVNGSEAIVEKDTFTVTMERFCEFDIEDFYGTYSVVEDGTYNYKVVASAGPVANTLELFNLYETRGRTIIELDNSDLEICSSKKLIGVDPGKLSLVYMTDDKNNKLRYTSVQRRKESLSKRCSRITLTEKKKHGIIILTKYLPNQFNHST